MNPALAIDYLTKHFASPNQAVRKLDDLNEAAGLLRIYQYFFPAEFRASNCRLITRAGDLQTTLVNCLELVSRNLFEIHDSFFDGMIEDDLPLSYIPIEPIFAEWWNDDADEMMLLWQALLILIGAWEPYDTDDETIQAAFKAGQQWQNRAIDCDKLTRLCHRADEPLCWLNLAVRTLDHSTGNPWLDASYECPIVHYDWTVRNVLHLKRRWREAQQACNRIMKLNEWLGEDVAHTHQLLALWSRALADRRSDQNQSN